jgi:hypothetical protein
VNCAWGASSVLQGTLLGEVQDAILESHTRCTTYFWLQSLCTLLLYLGSIQHAQPLALQAYHPLLTLRVGLAGGAEVCAYPQLRLLQAGVHPGCPRAAAPLQQVSAVSAAG